MCLRNSFLLISYYNFVNDIITVNQAVQMRINELLIKNDITQYRLEQDSGLSHGVIGCIMRNRNKNVTLKTIMMLAKGFKMSLIDFLNSPYFIDERIELE